MHSDIGQSDDLRRIIAHRESVSATDTLESVHKRFAEHEFEFMAVLDGQRFVGLCSRQHVGMLLGARFGFALHSRRPICEMLLKEATSVTVNQSIPEILPIVFSRSNATLFDDVALVDARGELLGLIFSRTLVRLQNGLLLEKIEQLQKKQAEINQKNEQFEEDLRLAREIQLAMLPEEPSDIPAKVADSNRRLRFCHRYYPAGVVSGDFFHTLHISDHAAGVFICDVMGHGVRSAFVTAMLRTLVEELRQLGENPAQLLTRMNQELKSILRQTGSPMFATALYLVADTLAGKIQFARAGHPSGLHLRRDTGKAEFLCCAPRTEGPALGLFSGASYGNSEADFSSDDLILLFTDGLYEVFDENENEFGRERLLAAISSRRALPLDELMDDLISEIRTYCGNREFSDDVCLVGMEAAYRDRPILFSEKPGALMPQA
jgi:serine phosphatase RsbU (regulator of sigma subunit)